MLGKSELCPVAAVSDDLWAGRQLGGGMDSLHMNQPGFAGFGLTVWERFNNEKTVGFAVCVGVGRLSPSSLLGFLACVIIKLI